MEDTERPTRLGSGAWGRRQGLAGLRDDAPSEARGADGERAGRRPQAPTRRQAREHKLRGRQAGSSRRGHRTGSSQRGGRRTGSSQRGGRRTGSSQRGGRRAGSSRHGLRDDAPSEARGADGERAGRRPQAPTRKQARELKLHGRRTGSSRRGLRDDAPSEARGADGERAAHSADGERAGRRPQAPTRRTRAYNEAGTRRAKQRRGPRPRETVRPGGPP